MSNVWVPVAESGYGLTFLSASGAVLNGSTVVSTQDGVQESQDAWSLALSGITDPVSARATVSGYLSDGQGGTFANAASLTVGSSGLDNVSITGLPTEISGFSPGQLVADLSSTYNAFSMKNTDWGAVTPLEDYSVLLEVSVPAPCEEYGRTTRAYVSGYVRDRVHSSRLYAQEKRCLVADFTGALRPGQVIVSAVWNMDCPYSVAMSAPTIDGLEARVMIQAAWPGWQAMRCTVTLLNGEFYSQLFMIEVRDAPYFGDVAPVAGPAQLSVTA